MPNQSLNGTKWRCIAEERDEYNKICTVIDGEINPDCNGENEIEIRYEDGSTAYPKLRRFMSRFEQLTDVNKKRPRWQNRNSIACPHCHTKQTNTLDDLTEDNDMSGSFPHHCEKCGKNFTVEFEYRPYIKIYS